MEALDNKRDQMEETPYQKGTRVLKSNNAELRNEWVAEILNEKEGGLALDALSNFADRSMLSDEEIEKLVAHLARTDEPSIAVFAYGGNAHRLFSEEQKRNLILTIIKHNDKISATNLLNTGRAVPEDLKNDVIRVSKEGAQNDQKGYKLL